MSKSRGPARQWGEEIMVMPERFHEVLE